MKSLADKLTDTVSKELSDAFTKKQVTDIGNLLAEMEKTGLVKKATYNFPLVDTIGRSYYTAANKQK